MRIQIDATPEELREKGPTLVKALASRLGVDLMSLLDGEDLLEKAEPPPTPHYGPIRDLAKQSAKVYNEEINLMLKEINEVLSKVAEG
jgi:hypothetical protein